MEVARSSSGISISQRKYVHDLLKETNMLGCKPVDTQMDPNIKIDWKKDFPPIDKGRYQRLVGKLIYQAHTRPNIGFVVSVISQFMNRSTEEQMNTAYRVLRFLKGSSGKGLLFRKTSTRGLEIYSDVDWAGSSTNRRSTSGIVHLYGET